MTRRLIVSLAALAALAVLVASCGDDDDAAQTDDPVVGDASGDGDEADAGGDSDVTIQDFAFEPESIEVAAGTPISFTNDDGVAHTVTSGTDSESDGTFDESLDSGSTAEITVDEAGTYAYFCAIHPSMTGEIVVS